MRQVPGNRGLARPQGVGRKRGVLPGDGKRIGTASDDKTARLNAARSVGPAVPR